MSQFNILSSELRIYGGNWTEKAKQNVADILKNKGAIAATVTSSIAPWGEKTFSLCFTTNGGQQFYLPLSKKSSLQEGDNVKVDSVCFITLGRPGSTDSFCYDGEKA